MLLAVYHLLENESLQARDSAVAEPVIEIQREE
jgi:hypothetical protein